MRDIYVMDNETGEIIPSEKAKANFYKSHKWDERWTDFYTATYNTPRRRRTAKSAKNKSHGGRGNDNL